MKRQWTGYHSVLANDIERFIVYKRALGRRYETEEKSLRLLDRYLVHACVQNPIDITAEIIEKFLASRPRTRPKSYNHLLCTVRQLFHWLTRQEILDHSPVRTPPKRQRYERAPFIFDLPAARQLLETAKRLPERSTAPMRGITYHAIFAILYGLGLRVGEVCRLQVKDVDFDRRLLVIRKTKFNKDRLVPFGPKLQAMLQDYFRIKTQRFGKCSQEAPFFSFTRRGDIHPGTVSQTFHHLVPRLRLDVPPGLSLPRLHDLRHSFAIGTLLRWYRQGADPGAGLLKLATFLGHVDANSTAVYLTMTPELLQEANRRFEKFASMLIPKEISQ